MTEAQVDVTADSDGGVLKAVVKAGLPGDAHRPLQGDRVHVHYVGTLEDGSKFDSSRDRGQTFSFTLGKGEVIKGWDIGVATMQKNETAVLTIKSQYGYGDTGSPPKIPGGATLRFEVELIDFEGEDVTKDKDKGVTKRILAPGEGFDHPNEESQLEPN
jgi:FK506-binding protein 4/5